jgi:hypothetical protein
MKVIKSGPAPRISFLTIRVPPLMLTFTLGATWLSYLVVRSKTRMMTGRLRAPLPNPCGDNQMSAIYKPTEACTRQIRADLRTAGIRANVRRCNWSIPICQERSTSSWQRRSGSPRRIAHDPLPAQEVGQSILLTIGTEAQPSWRRTPQVTGCLSAASLPAAQSCQKCRIPEWHRHGTARGQAPNAAPTHFWAGHPPR